MLGTNNDGHLSGLDTTINFEKKSLSTAQNQTYSSYEPPIFTDQNRLEKIQNVLPAIEQLFQQEFQTNHIPGLIYGIVVDGELLHSHSFGYANLEQKLPITTKSLFRIASMTKSITAMAIVKLRDEEKLRLDDPVDQYIPEVKMTDLLTNDAPILTIRHLLTQDAGMPEDDPWADRLLALPDTEFLSMLKKGISLSTPPGTKWEYTNLCYALIGRIITVVSQVSYQEYITREILHPLDMINTIWEYSEASPDLLARGYRWECEQYSEESLLHDGVYGAMGGLISSIEDFSKYMSYHLQAWPSRNEPEYGPIRRSSLREMQHPWNFIELAKQTDGSNPVVTSAYCYGLIWSKNNDGMISVNHTGGLPGFGSNWIILPEHGIGLVSFGNVTYADQHRINKAIITEIVTLADIKPRQLPVSKVLAERQQQIITLLQTDWDMTGPQIPMIFSENFFLDHSLQVRKTASQQLFSQAGKILKTGDLIPKNQLRGHFDIEGEDATIQITFSLSPENPPLIQELKLSKIK